MDVGSPQLFWHKKRGRYMTNPNNALIRREIHQTYPQNCIKFEDVVLNKILQSFGTPEILPGPSFFWGMI